ncbi:hypothetical protein [Verrucosispora sp. WMMC514]|uniref:hypothetical protein n=1 Tax=Verrucosispora sp. WMMC514 TaxID=3015156 RepID=UPI00248AD176|nr:hypothetical protein [Verrucosispora sp. WMMC514]WBB92110.1 hypothetical protein O7597_03520 [Verrucosispora sp. WMMC514]
MSRYLSQLAAEVVDAADINDIYEEAGLGKLGITELNEVALQRLQNSDTRTSPPQRSAACSPATTTRPTTSGPPSTWSSARWKFR